MTDKEQIIIDGVDVSKCEHLAKTFIGISNCCTIKTYAYPCKYNPNCYYKQLKCKEQECEELKKYITFIAEKFKLNDIATLNGKGALPYWAVLTSTIENKIDELQNQLTLKTKQLEVAREGLKNITNGTLPCKMPCNEKVKCWDEVTKNGKTCMLRIANTTLQQIEGMENNITNFILS